MSLNCIIRSYRGAGATTTLGSNATLLGDQPTVQSGKSGKRGKKKKEEPERRKVVLIQDRQTVVMHLFLYHSIPFGGAMGLIILNVSTRFYGVNRKWMPALQFVAKGHE